MDIYYGMDGVGFLDDYGMDGVGFLDGMASNLIRKKKQFRTDETISTRIPTHDES